MDNITTTQLLEWHKRGLALLPLHWVEDGHCSCRRPDCRSAGKHPIGTGWQTRPRPSWPDVMAWHEEMPGCNWGVRTGTPSGVWVLDFDPDNETDGAARALIGAVRLVAPTFEVQTGGGGLHLYFRMPPSWEPTNRRGQLPAGLDVRGTGGQVVIPPSVSSKGPYVVLSDVPPSNAPEWLLDLIRPPEQVSQSSVVQTGNDPYAHAAIERVLIEISHLREGERNQVGWHRARRIRELAAGAGWDGERFRDAFLNALMAAGLPYDEALSVWVSSGRAPVTPAGPEPATVIEGVLPPFALADPVIHREPSVIQRESALVTDDPVEALLAEMLTSADLDHIPPPRWLIDGYLVCDSLSRTLGKSGEMKSFVMLDMAMSVATGQPWQGRETVKGDVVYIAAEGAAGMRWRARAWEQAHHGGEPVKGIRFLPRPVESADHAAWAVLVEACRRLAPALVVLDTQARVTVGVNENDNTEMGVFVKQAEMLRAATGACVNLIHHLGPDGTEGRGARAVKGAMQSELLVRLDKSAGRVTVHVTKQKDGSERDPLVLKVHVVELLEKADGITSVTGESSVVLRALEAAVPTGGLLVGTAAAEFEQLPPAAARIFALFCEGGAFAEGGGGSRADAMSLVMGTGPGKIPKPTFHKSWNRLIRLGVIGRIAGTQRFLRVPPEDRTAPDVAVGEWIMAGREVSSTNVSETA